VTADSAKGHLLAAKMMMGEDVETMAEPELRAVLKMEPDLPEAHFLLGEVFLYRGDIDSGMAELQKEISINPAFAMAHYRLGELSREKTSGNRLCRPSREPSG
jgi:hypothetical protein